MLTDFSAREVGLQVIAHLERRRPDIAFDVERVRSEVEQALEPVRKEYAESELPPAYLAALEVEVRATVPSRWQALAKEFTKREQAQFGVWRGGDPVSRVSFVLLGLIIGGLIVKAPFIPIWAEWFPFVVAVASFFLPDVQVAWHRHRYARAIGDIALALGGAQPQLDVHLTSDLALPPRSDPSPPPSRSPEGKEVKP